MYEKKKNQNYKTTANLAHATWPLLKLGLVSTPDACPVHTPTLGLKFRHGDPPLSALSVYRP